MKTVTSDRRISYRQRGCLDIGSRGKGSSVTDAIADFVREKRIAQITFAHCFPRESS